MSKEKKAKGENAFKNYYQKYFSNEEKLEKFISHLKISSKPILRFSSESGKKLKKIWQENNLTWKPLKWHKYALEWPQEVQLGDDIPGSKDYLFYVQNASSLLPVIALDVKKNHLTLDACSAPGGKALFISDFLSSINNLIVNDLSTQRIQRVLKIFQEYKKNKPTYHTTNAAILFKRYPEKFDRILLDAPCSSEKHVWQSTEHLKTWSPGRIRSLKQTQLSLINGLFLALKPGGRMVYSTCAFTPEENELVIEKFLKKHKDECKIIPYPKNLPGYEKESLFGRIDITKKENENLDPMFIAIIDKNL